MQVLVKSTAEVHFTSRPMWYIIKDCKRLRTVKREIPRKLFRLPALYIFHRKGNY